jgi:hypothetical protein
MARKKREQKLVSASQASIEAANLTSIWSNETYLSLRTLIYCAELLEKLVQQPKRKPRKRSAWQQFLSTEMKAGASVQQASAKWKEKKAA